METPKKAANKPRPRGPKHERKHIGFRKIFEKAGATIPNLRREQHVQKRHEIAWISTVLEKQACDNCEKTNNETQPCGRKNVQKCSGFRKSFENAIAKTPNSRRNQHLQKRTRENARLSAYFPRASTWRILMPKKRALNSGFAARTMCENDWFSQFVLKSVREFTTSSLQRKCTKNV